MAKKIILIVLLVIAVIAVLYAITFFIYQKVYLPRLYKNIDQLMSEKKYQEVVDYISPTYRRMQPRSAQYFLDIKERLLLSLLRAESNLVGKTDDMKSHAGQLVAMQKNIDLIKLWQADGVPAKWILDDAKYKEVAVPIIDGTMKARYDEIMRNRPAINGRLFQAAEEGSKMGVLAALDEGADINARKEDSTTPLMAAVKASQSRMVEFLLQKGADVNAVDNEGKPAFDLVPQKNFATIINILLKYGATGSASQD